VGCSTDGGAFILDEGADVDGSGERFSNWRGNQPAGDGSEPSIIAGNPITPRPTTNEVVRAASLEECVQLQAELIAAQEARAESSETAAALAASEERARDGETAAMLECARLQEQLRDAEAAAAEAVESAVAAAAAAEREAHGASEARARPIEGARSTHRPAAVSQDAAALTPCPAATPLLAAFAVSSVGVADRFGFAAEHRAGEPTMTFGQRSFVSNGVSATNTSGQSGCDGSESNNERSAMVDAKMPKASVETSQEVAADDSDVVANADVGSDESDNEIDFSGGSVDGDDLADLLM